MVADLLRSTDPARLLHRRSVILRAVTKHGATGVKIPDIAVHRLKSEYLRFVAEWSEAERFAISLPQLCQSYYDGDSWVYPIRHAQLPSHIELRHRFWTSVKSKHGQVDLISTRPDESELARFRSAAVEGGVVSTFSKSGVQLSLRIPEIRPTDGFDQETTVSACLAMKDLVDWYLGKTSG